MQFTENGKIAILQSHFQLNRKVSSISDDKIFDYSQRVNIKALILCLMGNETIICTRMLS